MRATRDERGASSPRRGLRATPQRCAVMELDVKLWTHKIKGLSESDFVLAAKIDQVYSGDFGKG
jgi:hypothetical protein